MPRAELVSSLLSGFGRHRRENGKPEDHWLPEGIYDPNSWSIDSVYLYIITDGSVGGPTPGGLSQEAIHTCGPDTEARKELVARLAQKVSHEDAVASGAGEVSWQALLTERLGCDLSAAAAELATAGRPALLMRLKAAGVDQLTERQKLVNSLARASREGRVRGYVADGART